MPVKQRIARAVIGPEYEPDLVVSPQVIGEFYVTVTRKLEVPLSPGQALALVGEMTRQPVVPLDSTMAIAAILGAHEWQLSYWDALLMVAARTAGCDRLLTEDLQHGRVIDGVTIVNPFLQSDP